MRMRDSLSMRDGCLHFPNGPEIARMRQTERRRLCAMKYGIDFRYLAKGAATPADNSYVVDVELDESQFALVPNIGDHVCVPGDNPGMRNVPLSGKVRSRLFSYRLGYCYVTVVVEDSDDDWQKLGGT
jgi:hypothetical protein